MSRTSSVRSSRLALGVLAEALESGLLINSDLRQSERETSKISAEKKRLKRFGDFPLPASHFRSNHPKYFTEKSAKSVKRPRKSLQRKEWISRPERSALPG